MREKREVGKIFALMGSMLILGAAVLAYENMDADAYRSSGTTVYENGRGERYLFLPSWADAAREEARLREEEGGEAVEILQSQNLASVEIRTASGSMDAVREEKGHGEAGRIRITGADGGLLYEGGLDEIRGRGHSTWSLDKKPYQIRLSEKADLFGMGEAKTWILLANGFDETCIRNSVALWLADRAGLAFTPEQEPVDLYCNGEYQGSSLFCEKVQARENRVEIGDGFLIERELQERWELAVYTEGESGFVTDRGDYYLIDFPKDPGAEQIEEIRSLVQAAEDAVFSEGGVHPETGKSWDEYVDAKSFARKYLLEEITKNYDGGVTSAFYYVPEGEAKLYAGPAWDYDLIFGNAALDEMNSDPRGITELSDHLYGPDLYGALMDLEPFRETVFDCFETVYLPLLEELIESGIDEMAAWTEASVKMDHLRWEEMENRYQYYGSYEDNLRYLKFFVRERTEFLKEVWVGGEVYRTVTMEVEGIPWRKFYVKDGGLLGDLPVPFLNDSLFMGWYRQDGKKYDPYRPVYEDMTLEAAWQKVG